MTRGVPRWRRAATGATAALVCLALGACTPGQVSPPPDDVAATTGALPTGATTTGAPPAAHPAAVDDEAVLEVVAAMDAALQDGDAEAFLSHVDPAIASGQRVWFEAVRSVPMDVRQLRPDRVVSRSSPAGTVVHVALRHQLSRADAVPVVEQYRWVLAPGGDGAPRLVEVGERHGVLHGYPQLWDLGPVAVLEGQDVLLLAPEDARADAEALLDDVGEAARRLREDYPVLAEGQEVLTVQLVPGSAMADMMDTVEEDLPSGTTWLRTSGEDPGLDGLGLLPPEGTLGHRLLLDLDVASEELELFGPGGAGNGYVRGVGAHTAVVGADEDHVPVAWLMVGVPTWYELADDPELEELMLTIAADAHVDGPPEALPDVFRRDPDDLGHHAASLSLVRHLEETYGRAAVLALASRLGQIDAWYDEDDVWPAVEAELGVDEAQLLTDWQAWGEELLTRAEPRQDGSVEG